MKFLGTHRSNIKNQITTNIRRVKRGMVIFASYKSEATGKSKLGMYLILDVFFRTKKVHAIDITFINENELHRLFKLTKTKQPITESISGRKFTLFEFKPENPRTFYTQKIRPLLLQARYEDVYRTMFIQNFKNVKIVDYEWQEQYFPPRRKIIEDSTSPTGYRDNKGRFAKKD